MGKIYKGGIFDYDEDQACLLLYGNPLKRYCSACHGLNPNVAYKLYFDASKGKWRCPKCGHLTK